jgi:hypothetical protein
MPDMFPVDGLAATDEVATAELCPILEVALLMSGGHSSVGAAFVRPAIGVIEGSLTNAACGRLRPAALGPANETTATTAMTAAVKVMTQFYDSTIIVHLKH